MYIVIGCRQLCNQLGGVFLVQFGFNQLGSNRLSVFLYVCGVDQLGVVQHQLDS